MRLLIEADLEYCLDRRADVLLQIEAAATADQRIVTERLTVWSDRPVRAAPGEDGVGQRCWIDGEGPLRAEYRATVEIERPPVVLDGLAATPARAAPAALTAYLLPSRYCPVDRLYGFVEQRFAGLTGGALAAALAGWVGENIAYRADASNGDMTALDTFGQRAGVCRDFAHLLVTFARAGGIPARCVSAYAPGVDPPDFHAVAELWLEEQWHLVDATGMARADELARVAVGRDAVDIAFMTVFGRATLVRQAVRVVRAD
ncbi:transglutaminase-like domain-containing protein [Sphingomonas sp.]|uniref:transglutaminase-like domain-containing protein n=1 Tax=Sphingomonas sp. TaxID=28214 RepID=UPI003CC5F729